MSTKKQIKDKMVFIEKTKEVIRFEKKSRQNSLYGKFNKIKKEGE